MIPRSVAILAALLLTGCPDRPTPSPATPPSVKTAPLVKPLEQAPVRLVHIPGSTIKLEQLIGDKDRHLKRKTLNLTRTRYGIVGADLGASFEHDGQVIFLFGDTIGPGGGDAIAFSSSTSAGDLRLSFFEDKAGGYLKVKPEGELMRGFEVPVGGVSVGGVPYLFCKRGWTRDGDTDGTSLVRFDPAAGTFTTVRAVSARPGGKFIKVSPRLAPAGLTGLPGQGEQVLIWGTGRYRKSRAYLSVVRAADIEKPGSTTYFSGWDKGGRPRWSKQEAAAVAVVEDDATLGDISVIYNEALNIWLMTHDSRATRGIIFRHAPAPWGPWSAGQVIFNAGRDGLGRFIHRKGSEDGLARPVIGSKAREDPVAVQGGAYAPYMVERFTTLEQGRLAVHFLMSTWNPYVVVLMRAQFKVQR